MSPTAKPLLRAIRGETVTSHPFWLMRQAGRYLPEYRAIRAQARDFVQLCLTPDLATEITIQPVRRYGMDAAILFSDILMIPYALGQGLAFQEGEGPKLDPIRNRSGLAALAETADLGRLEPVYETLRRVRTAIAPETTLIGFVGAPWTLSTYMIEGGSSRSFSLVRAWAAEDPEAFSALINRLTAAVIAHADAQIAAGAEVIQLFDSWAGAAGADGLEPWVIRPASRIVAALRTRWPDVPIIGFPKGIGPSTEAYAAATGVDMISIDTTASLAFARDRLQPICAVQGNLDPGRFVFNLGHGVLQTTPPEHVAELTRHLRSIAVVR
jgi:uroporphyrinogen decarboxylase